MSRLILLLFLGLSIRLLFIGNPGFVADISFWKSWSLAAVDHGIVWTAHNTNINYPTGFIYVLWLMGKAYSFVGNAHNFNSYWQDNNFAFLFVSKMLAIISDLIITCLIYWFTAKILKSDRKERKTLAGDTSEGSHEESSLSKRLRQNGNHQNNIAQDLKRVMGYVSGRTRFLTPLVLSSLFLFNPVTILDSAVWGQVESFGLLFTLLAVILIYYKKPVIASAIFTVGFMMKLQNIIYIPLIYLFIWRHYDFKILVKSLASSLFTFTLIIFPFLLAHDMDRVLLLLTVNNDYFPWLSLHAHNPWWILAGGNMMASDKILTLGVLSAKTLGLILFSSSYLLLVILLLKKTSFRNFILSLGISIFAFFLLTTQSHERYSYPVLVWLLMLIPFLENKKWLKYVFILYGLLTVAIFFNMHEGLVANYPNGIELLTRITNQLTNNLNSAFLVVLFLSTFPLIFKELSPLYSAIPVIFLILSVFFLNFSYLFQGRISLTSLKPTSVRQDYGTLQYNKSVNSFLGPKSWNVLSSNYFFYKKGLGTHAVSDLTYDLKGRFSKFSSDIGIDTEANELAGVNFQILGDGRTLYTSPKIGRFDFPRHIDVDIRGVKTLQLIVTNTESSISNDHADWLSPVLYR